MTLRLPATLAAPLTVLLLSTPMVGAATISVTTTNDEIINDSECSLREAITAANTNAAFQGCPAGEDLPAVDVIELPPGTYRLTLEPVGEDLNAGGDLDITQAVTIRGLGDPFRWWDDPGTPEIEVLDVYLDPSSFQRTFDSDDLPDVVIENGLGKALQLGDGDRVLHVVIPSVRRGIDLVAAEGHATVRGGVSPGITLENLALVGGDASCVGMDCDAGAAGLLHEADVPLILDRVALFDNRVGCAGAECGTTDQAAAVRTNGSAAITISESVIAANRASCADTACRTGRILSLNAESAPASEIATTRSLLADNVQTCSSTDCSVREFFQGNATSDLLEQTVVLRNEISCAAAGFHCNTDDFIEFEGSCVDPGCSVVFRDLELAENQLLCEGFECDTDELLEESTALAWEMTRVRFRENVQRCSGFECDVDELMDQNAASEAGATFSITDLEIIDNVNECTGTGCDSDDTLDLWGSGVGTMTRVFLRGESRCSGNECSTDQIVEASGFASITDLELRDTAVFCDGASCQIYPAVQLDPPDGGMTIDGLVIADSSSTCTGTGCGFGGVFDPGFPGEGGLLALNDSAATVDFVLTDASVTGNATTARGTIASRATVRIEDSVVSGNSSSSDGAAIFNGRRSSSPDPVAPGDLELHDTMVESNVATGTGGGVHNPPGATVALFGVTITGNTAADGGGIFNEGTIVARQASAISGNVPNQCVDSGAGSGCGLIFTDDFESGGTTAWQ